MSEKRTKIILKRILEIYPEPTSELRNWQDDFQFLICVMLSSQTTDFQVNRVTEKLFREFPNIGSFLNADISNIEKIISAVNYYRTKSKHILKSAEILERDFNSRVPRNVIDLLTLPGVGKKTANVFLNEMFKSNQGIPVDTHVSRIARRLDLSNSVQPVNIARDLEKLFPKEEWYKVNSSFVLFGKNYCKAKKPLCRKCVLSDLCSSGDKVL